MATDNASLKISIDSRDVKNAKTDLDNLSKSSSNAENSAKQTTSAFKGLGVVLSSVAAGALAKEFIQTADAMNMLNARLRLVTSSVEEYKSQQAALLKISKDSYSPLADTISLYTKLDPALKRMGATTAGVNEVVDSFSKGLKLGGASAAESSAAMLQFAQAMGSGVLRGDEFNSMMEASPKLMSYVAEGMGKPVTALRRLAEEGKLTAGEVSASMLLMSDKIEDDFKTLPKTVSGALTNIKTDLALMVDEINNANGVTSTLANILSDVSITTKNSSDTFLSLGSTVSQTTLDIVDIAKELGSLISAFNDISEDGAGLSLFEAGLTGLRITLDTVYVGLHNAIIIAKELVKTSKDLFSGKETNFLQNVNKQILTMDDLVNRYSTSLEKSTQKQVKNNEEIKKGVLDKKAEAKTILAKADLLRKEAEAEKAKEAAAKKAIKAEEDRLKKSHEIAQSQLKMIQDESDKKIKLQEDYYNTLNDIVQKNDSEKLDGLAKEAFDTFAHYDSLIEKYKEVAGAESALRATQAMAIDTIIEKQKELDEAYNNKTAIDSLDEIYNRYEKLIDAQIELAENGMNIDFDFGDGAKELNNIFKATQQLHLGSLKYTKQDMKLQEDFAKNFLEAKGDELKEKEIVANFDADNAKLKEAQSNAEMAAYSSLAGAMTSAFEKGSAGAIAFTTLQSALGIASSWAAIANAWALPFPANIPAVAMVASAVMPIISQLGGSSGGGGGGTPTTSTGFSFDQNREQTEGTYEPMTDRLDRQIELLESIDRQGSASQLGIELSATSFERDTRIWLEDVLEKARQGLVNAGMNATQTSATAAMNNQSLGIDVWQAQGTKIGYNESVLRDGTNLIKTLIAMSEESLYTGTLYQAAALEAGYNWSNMMSFVKIEIEKDINEYQNLVSEWSLSVIDSMSDLKDAASDFKGYYDDITGSMFYETARLNEAFADVDRLRGTASFADYLKTSIDDIKALETFFTDDVFNLLMSNDTADIEAQIAAVDELGRVTGQTFEGGAREALDYLESIELVAEAMARSRENIKSFTDSLLTDEQLTGNLASALGVELATNVEELAALFNRLAYDMDGLTDIELDLLNANKSLLETTYAYKDEVDSLNLTLDNTSKAMGTLDSALNTIESTIEKLKVGSRTSEQSLQIYYDAIAEAQRLSTTNLYEDYAKAVSKASDATSALFKVENFSSQAEMDFAQLSAAFEFGLLEDITLDEIDYLKMIEENTREQISAILLVVEALGAKINQAIFPYEDTVNSAYQSVLGRDAETAGSNYWQGQISAGNVAANNIGVAVGAAAATNGEISRSDYVTQLYTQGLGRTPSAEEVDYWAKSSETPLTQLASTFASLDPKFQSFAVGTPNVPYDMMAQIHQGEMIVPKTFNEGLQSGNITIGQNNNDAMVRELNNLNQKQNAIITILQESQNIQNINLQKLTLIEAAN